MIGFYTDDPILEPELYGAILALRMDTKHVHIMQGNLSFVTGKAEMVLEVTPEVRVYFMKLLAAVAPVKLPKD